MSQGGRACFTSEYRREFAAVVLGVAFSPKY
jgi:hypothetical protein